MSAITAEHRTPTSSASDFSLTGFSGITRSLTRAFLAPWREYGKQPKDAEAMGMKGRIMADRMEPMKPILRLSFAAVDAGIPWPSVVAWAGQYVAQVREYAERRTKRLGFVSVLPFPERWARVQARDSVEEGEANAACWRVIPHDADSLEACRKELCDQRQSLDDQITLLDEKLAELRARA